MKGIVFDIQKFALHDGPGIRTVVFLKGCPFKCVWCCNPESISPEPQLAFDDRKCTRCMKCIPVCPVSAIKNKDGEPEIDFSACTACGACLESCVKNALKIYGYETDSQAVLIEVLKDWDYYKNSGGGLTLSGGDPLFQFDFAYEILLGARKMGMDTCVESEGYGTIDQFRKLLPVVNRFYFDYKITDDFLHRKYTGVSNEKVLANLKFLGENNADITMRCILIPGINDTEEHFKAISSLSNQYPSIRGVEIMPYHDYGSGKYKQLGKPLYPLETDSVKPELANSWLTRLNRLGCKNVKRG